MTKKGMWLAVVLALAGCDQQKDDGGKDEPKSKKEAKEEKKAQPAPEPAPQPKATFAAGGLWEGTFSSPRVSGTVMGLVTESGDARFVSPNGVQHVGKVSVQGDSVTGTLKSFVDNKAAGDLTLEAKVSPKGTFDGKYTAAGESGTFALKYNSEYERTVTVADLAGKWGSKTFEMAVEPSGAFKGRDGAGCLYDGKVAQIDPRFNAFTLTFSVAACPHGGSYNGLTALTKNNLPEELMAYGVSGTQYGVAGFLGRGKDLGTIVAWREDVDKAVQDANKAVGDANKAVGDANKAAGQANDAAQKAKDALKGLGR